jgi:hypothetical protein
MWHANAKFIGSLCSHPSAKINPSRNCHLIRRMQVLGPCAAHPTCTHQQRSQLLHRTLA